MTAYASVYHSLPIFLSLAQSGAVLDTYPQFLVASLICTLTSRDT